MIEEHSIGSRIKMARLNALITQSQLCAKAKLSKGFLSDLEANKRNPSVRVLTSISDATGVSVEWLIRGTHTKPMACPMCRGKGEIRL